MTTETQQINNQKLIDFAQAVGADIKRLNEQFNALPQPPQIAEQLTALEAKLKQDLFGGDVQEAYDTFKEIADKLDALDGSVAAAVTGKLTELRTQLQAVQTVVDTDLLATYNAAKA